MANNDRCQRNDLLFIKKIRATFEQEDNNCLFEFVLTCSKFSFRIVNSFISIDTANSTLIVIHITLLDPIRHSRTSPLKEHG